MTEDEMVGWHYQLIGYEFEQAPGDVEGQESLVCCSPWGRKESNTTQRLKNNIFVMSDVNAIIKLEIKDKAKSPKSQPPMTKALIKEMEKPAKVLRDEWESRNNLTLNLRHFTNLNLEVTLKEQVI